MPESKEDQPQLRLRLWITTPGDEPLYPDRDYEMMLALAPEGVGNEELEALPLLDPNEEGEGGLLVGIFTDDSCYGWQGRYPHPFPAPVGRLPIPVKFGRAGEGKLTVIISIYRTLDLLSMHTALFQVEALPGGPVPE